VFVHTFAREQHVTIDPASRIQESFTYSDGFGRVAMQKVQAEPEPGSTIPRWVGTGRTVFNNKGNPVKQYEPFFSATSDFEDEDAIVATGVTPIIHYDPLDRVIRTDLPDGTLSKVEFDTWKQETWDQNDTVLESQWYIDRGSPSASGPEPSAPEARAAWLAAQHAGTPTVAHLDTLGRPFLSDAHNRTNGVDDHYFTRTKLDIEGNTLAIFDARQIKANAANPLPTIEQTFDVLQRRLKVVSADAGTRLTVADVAGKPLRSWDSRGQTQRQRFDALQRPTHAYVRKGAPERLLLRTVYGEALDPPGAPPTDPAFASPAQQANLRGRAHHVYDCAGLITSIEHDFKGNLLSASRRLAIAYQTEPDWSLNAAADLTDPADILSAVSSLLQSETFTTESTFDALNRVTTATAPDADLPTNRSVTRSVYNEANLLDAVHVAVRGGSETPVITDLQYNARGQRTSCQYQNGTVTTYQYDPKTFRLTELLTLGGGTELQHLLYSYDPVGNITDIQDLSNWDPVLSALTAAGVTGSGKYRYDALYRLLSATGREHPGPQPDGRTENEPPRWGIPHGNDLQALQSYREELTYDEVGNILEMRHLRGASNNASWSRRYDYFPDNNRLRATSAPGDAIGTYSDPYGYQNDASNDAGAHGSMTSMPHLADMEWDYADRLKHALKSNGSAQDTYFTYDAMGQRARKVYHHNGLIEERIYLGGYEVYRRHTSGSITAIPDEERQTLHVMDDQRRIAMVETKTREAGAAVANPVSRWRFQLDNHLGSAMLELDASGNAISYEEYHPYGSTAFHTANVNAGASAKRYRYTGKEKDDETGLYYHGARYYAPWLGRWTAADPAGMIDGLNLYRYARNNPMKLLDPNGMESQPQTFEDRSIRLEVKHAGSADSLQYSLSVDLQKRGTGDRFEYTSSGGAAGLRTVHEQLMRSEGFAEALTPAEREHLFATIEDFARDVPADGTLYGAPSGEGGQARPNTPDTDGGSNFTGQAGVTTYESNVRKGYESRIKSKSAQAVEAIDDAAREGNVAKAESVAREASSFRNQERAGAQRRLLPGGRALSSALEKERTYEQLAKKYAVPGKPIDTAREVAKAAGRSNRVVSGLGRAGRVLGPIGLAVGIGLGVREYVNAPPERKAAVAAGETGALIGGAIGFSLGTGAATLALGTALAVSGPVGWAALGAVLLTGAVAGYFGAEWGRSLTSGFFE
jgi:RHS repeat-associated protein